MRKSNNPAGRPIDRDADERIAALIQEGLNVRKIVAKGYHYTRIKRVERERGLKLKVGKSEPHKRWKPTRMTLVQSTNYAAEAANLRWGYSLGGRG